MADKYGHLQSPSPEQDLAAVQEAIARNRLDSGADSELVRLPLEKILDRSGGDTRPVKPERIPMLLKSIEQLGLIAPIAVDAKGRLLAGGHRREALLQLKDSNLPRFNDLFTDGIPCRRYNFDSEADAIAARAVEIAENEQRHNYTREEIREVAKRLQAQGYSLEKGRRNKEPLIPALMEAFNVSRSTVKRALREVDPNGPPEPFGPEDASDPNGPPEPFGKEPNSTLTVPASVADRIRAQAKAVGKTVGEFLASYPPDPYQVAHEWLAANQGRIQPGVVCKLSARWEPVPEVWGSYCFWILDGKIYRNWMEFCEATGRDESKRMSPRPKEIDGGVWLMFGNDFSEDEDL